VFFKQYSLEGLACQSYFVGDGDNAVVVDPQRDVDIYLETAREQDMPIRHVIDTHLHADHVSGNTELAHRTGAVLHIHPAAEARYPHIPLNEADEIQAGAVRLRALFTPGHTLDHVSLAVTDANRSDEPWFVLTGDWVFVGDIGRPDLLGLEASRRLAAQMYDSLHSQFARLPDSAELYPGHGAGSLCGRAMSAKLSSTVGFERRFNPSLGIENKEEFVEILTTDLPSQPPNVAFIKQLNREGPPVLGELAPHHLSARKARRLLQDGAALVDTRAPEAFGAGHAKTALNIVLSSNQFATRLGFLTPPGTPIVFVARGAEECLSAFRAAIRVGLDRVEGYLTAAEAKALPAATLPHIGARHLHAALKEGGIHVLDVRERGEYAMGHVPGAQWIPLGQLPGRLDELPKDGQLAVICAGGLRSSSAASLLARSGFADVVNVPDGFDGWEKAGLPIER
jgi:hydroxyacylglutathione hydrolase